MSGSPLVRIFEIVTAEAPLCEEDIVLYEYSCHKTGKWRWSIGTVGEIAVSKSLNSSVMMLDWILPSSTRTSRLHSYANSPTPLALLDAPDAVDSPLQNGVQFTPGKSITTVPRSSVFAKFKNGIAQADQPILLSKADLSQIGQLLRFRRHAVENSVNSEELMAMVRSLLQETAKREEFHQSAVRESLSDQFKQLVQLMELQALKEGATRPHATESHSSSFAQLTPSEMSATALGYKLEPATISTMELVIRDEEGSRLALLKDEAYQAMALAVPFYTGCGLPLQLEGNSSRTPLQPSAAKVEELRYRLRSRQSSHLSAVEKLQDAVNTALEQSRGTALSSIVHDLISAVDAAVELLSDDGCEQDVRAPTPIPSDARHNMTLRFASVRSAASSRAGSRERSPGTKPDAVATRSPTASCGAEPAVNPYRSPSRASPLGRPPTRDDSPSRPLELARAAPDWSPSERSIGSRAEDEHDQIVCKLRAELEEERDRRLAVEGRMSMMTVVTEELSSGLVDGAAPFNETIALQRRMLQQLQMEIAKRMDFVNILEEQLRAMRRSKRGLMGASRLAVRQPTDDTEELYAQFNRRIAILLTQREQVQEEVRGREKEMRSVKALLSSAITLTSAERRSGSYRRTADDVAEDWKVSSEEREGDALVSA